MRRQNKYIRKESIRDARLIIVATEGRYTEKIYIEALAVDRAKTSVHVRVLQRNEGEENNSSPRSVYQQLDQYKKAFDIADTDELWLVIDRDKWTEVMLSEVAKLCQQSPQMKLALSNPCFELWLAIHLEDVSALPAEVKNLLMRNDHVSMNGHTYMKTEMVRLLGSYQESKYDTTKLIPHVDVAIKRAKMLDVNPSDRWPQDMGTRMYLLAESIIK